MAILTGINTRLRGSAGDWTYARLNGQTVAKQKVAPKDVPVRSYRQMLRRVQWANIVNVWRAFSGNNHPSFENRGARVSDFNEFMSANLGSVPVYLTKDQARQGGAVIAAYQVTRGSLPSIVMEEVPGTGGAPGKVSTDIALGSLTVDASTTVKEFSEAVVSNNGDYFHGDQITCFLARQTVNATSQVPYVKIDAMEVTLDLNDNSTKLYDVVDAEGFSSNNGRLGTSLTNFTGGIVWIHSRRAKSKTAVSSQRFLVKGNLLQNYTTEAARTEAILSYGGVLGDQFLTPNDENVAAPVNP